MDDLELLKKQQKQELNTYLEQTKEESLYRNDMYRDGSQSIKEEKSFTPGDELKDTATLGKKVFKASSEAERQHNEKIDKSLELTKKATAYTAETLHIVKSVETNITEGARTAKKISFQPETMVYRLNNYNFTPEMFSSANIRANLAEYVALVKGFQELRDLKDQSYFEMLGTSRNIMEIFEKRIEIYLEQNRVDMKGNIIDDKKEPRSLSPNDLKLWNNLIRSKTVSDEEEERETEADDLQKVIEEKSARLEEYRKLSDYHRSEEFVKHKEKISSGIALKTMKEEEDNCAQAMIVLRGEVLLNKLKLRLKEESVRKGISAEERKKRIEEIEKEISETKEDLKNLAERDMKRTLKEVTRRETGLVSGYRMTRDEATDTPSDRACFKSKGEFREMLSVLNETLESARPFPSADMIQSTKHLRDAVLAYSEASHYKEGHEKETELLKKALAELGMMESYKKEDLDFRPEIAETVRNLRAKFDELTKGSKTIPDLSKIPENLVYIPQGNPEESTSKNKGGTRNAIMNNDVMRIWKSEKDTPLFSHEPTVNDVRQGKISNCYMVAGTTGLIGLDPEILKNAIRDNGDGTATVRLFRKGSKNKAIPVYVVVTKEVPKLRTGGDVLSSGALWMQLIEKAAASLGKSSTDYGYQSIWYGEGGEWLFKLTGQQPQPVFSNGDTSATVESKKEPGKTIDYLSPEGQDILFEEIMNAKANNIVFNCGTGEDASDALNAGHAYTVLGGKIVSGVRYVILRNPYANMSLRYDDMDRMYMKNGRTASYFSTGIGETCGQFVMKYEEFLREMNGLTKTDLTGHFEEPKENFEEWIQEYMEEVDKEVNEQDKEKAKLAKMMDEADDLNDLDDEAILRSLSEGDM